MPNLTRFSVKQLAFFGGTFLVVFFVVCAVVSYLGATKDGERYEEAIRTADLSLQAQKENLRQSLMSITRLDAISTSQAEWAARVISRRAGRPGAKIVLRGLNVPSMGAAAGETLDSLTKALVNYNAKSFKTRSAASRLRAEYKSQLESVWSGFWLRAAGYPREIGGPAKKPARWP